MTLGVWRFIISFSCLMLAAQISFATSRDAGSNPEQSDAGPRITEEQLEESTLSPDRMPTIELTVEPKTADIGDLISWKVNIKRRAGDRVHLASESSFGGLEVQDKNTNTGAPEGDWLVETLEIKLISFEAGEFIIPAQKLTAVDIEGNIATILTKEIPIEIKSLIANEAEPDIKKDNDPGVPVYVEDYTLAYIGVFLLGTIIIILLTLLGRKLWAMRKPKLEPPPPPPRPAEEIAIEKLEQLRGSPLLVEGRHKEFHVFLSEAVREYVGNRYKFHSLDRSTEELILDLKNQNLEQPIFDRLVAMLEDTDFVKFAKYIPSMDMSNEMIKGAFEVVHITTPTPITKGNKTEALTADESKVEGGHDA